MKSSPLSHNESPSTLASSPRDNTCFSTDSTAAALNVPGRRRYQLSAALRAVSVHRKITQFCVGKGAGRPA